MRPTSCHSAVGSASVPHYEGHEFKPHREQCLSFLTDICMYYKLSSAVTSMWVSKYKGCEFEPQREQSFSFLVSQLPSQWSKVQRPNGGISNCLLTTLFNFLTTVKNPVDNNCWSSNYWIRALLKGGLVDIWQKSKICQGHKLLKTPWRNGSASDSRSEGCVFKSRRGQQMDIFKFPLHLQSKAAIG